MKADRNTMVAIRYPLPANKDSSPYYTHDSPCCLPIEKQLKTVTGIELSPGSSSVTANKCNTSLEKQTLSAHRKLCLSISHCWVPYCYIMCQGKGAIHDIQMHDIADSSTGVYRNITQNQIDMQNQTKSNKNTSVSTFSQDCQLPINHAISKNRMPLVQLEGCICVSVNLEGLCPQDSSTMTNSSKVPDEEPLES